MTEPHPTDLALNALPPPLAPPEIDPDLLEVESLKVIARLRRHGHTAYLVGGCVRDVLCNVSPKDYDVATGATPEEIRSIFRNSRLIGRRFRLAHVYFPGGKFIEVATFRSNPLLPEPCAELDDDGEEVDGTEEIDAELHDGDEVDADEDLPNEPVDLFVTDDNQFGTAQEDALRRDFTVNGLFYEPAEGRIIDYVGGRADVEAKLIRTIGDAEIRLQEDPVRALRAARIAAKLGFEIEETTFQAMVNHADALPRCAPARVLEETLKLLRSGASSQAFAILRRAKILRVLLPPIEKFLRAGGPETEAKLFARLDALDAMLEAGEPVSDAVMLATLLSFLPDEEHEGPANLTLPSADKVLSQMSAQARLPRRIADRVRAVLAAQKLFVDAPKKKRRRRGGAGFVRTPHFADSLHLFEITVRVTGEHQEALQTWKRRAAGEPEEKPRAAPVPLVADAAAPAKKKRRRAPRTKKKPDATASEGDEKPPASGTPADNNL